MMSSRARPFGVIDPSASMPYFIISNASRSRRCSRSSSVSCLRPSASLILHSSPEAARTSRMTASSSFVSRSIASHLHRSSERTCCSDAYEEASRRALTTAPNVNTVAANMKTARERERGTPDRLITIQRIVPTRNPNQIPNSPLSAPSGSNVRRRSVTGVTRLAPWWSAARTLL